MPLSSLVRAGALACLLAPFAANTTPALAKPVVEVAFVIDTTGSMGALIEGAKRKVWSIATTIVEENPRADIRMGLVAYRDIGDEYVTRRFELTTDIQDMYAHLLELKARGGGDWPESVNEALHTAVTKLSWTGGDDVRRIIFLVGDAPPHMDYAQDVKYPEVMEIARRRDILVNAVQAGGARDTEKVWRTIAQMGGGRYIPIPQDGGKVVIIETPYDTTIIELQEEINGTVIPYGPRSRRSAVDGKTKQMAAAPRATATEMASYMNKRAVAGSGEAVTGEGDLVADVAAGRQKLDAVKKDELPDEVANLAPAERDAFVQKRLAQRKALNERMMEVVKKRDRYVSEARAKTPGKAADSFDRAVEETLRAQLKR